MLIRGKTNGAKADPLNLNRWGTPAERLLNLDL